ncbi:MAG TPA: MFS transporter [Thermomicrobiales bacterium]|nr:MFS transporter [Thermomicrobiales bacterium]
MDRFGKRRDSLTVDSDNSLASARDDWQCAGWQVGGGYFWYYAGIGAFIPFVALHFRELGYSGPQVGLLTALPSVGVAIGGPLAGAVADALSVHRWVLRIALLVGTVLALLASMIEAFPFMLAAIAPLALVLSPVPSMMDSYAVTASERANRSYGALRVWGSVGYMAAVLVMGRVMGERVSALLFVGYALCLGLTLLTVFALPPLAERRAQPLLTGIHAATANRPLMTLLLVAYLLSIGTAAMNIYLGVHLEEIGGSASLIGVAFAISAASELPIVAFGSWFLVRLGPVRLAALAIVVYALRFAGYSAITVPEWVLGIQLFHGLSYGAFLIASVTLAHRLAGQEQASTAQALLTAMSFGFGSITGSLLGGVLLDVVGTAGLFGGSAGLMVVTLAVLAIGNRLVGLGGDKVAGAHASG